MRALVPLGEKSSESVPERVLPYRHLFRKIYIGKLEIYCVIINKNNRWLVKANGYFNI